MRKISLHFSLFKKVLANKRNSDVFGITAGPPLHDPLALAAVLTGTPEEIVFYDWDGVKSQGTKHNERFDVTVITEGTAEEAQRGEKQTGRTIANVLPAGEAGVRIPRGVDVDQFWQVIEECIERADETNRKLSN